MLAQIRLGPDLGSDPGPGPDSGPGPYLDSGPVPDPSPDPGSASDGDQGCEVHIHRDVYGLMLSIRRAQVRAAAL
jgi:hypothetical protein